MSKTLDRKVIEAVAQTAMVLAHHVNDEDTMFVSVDGKASITLSKVRSFAAGVLRLIEIEADGETIDSICRTAGLLRNRFGDGDVEVTNNGSTGLLSGIHSFADGVLDIASVVKSLPPE